jgi:hypothetical protein
MCIVDQCKFDLAGKGMGVLEATKVIQTHGKKRLKGVKKNQVALVPLMSQ